jgi:hypothetical protein
VRKTRLKIDAPIGVAVVGELVVPLEVVSFRVKGCHSTLEV